MFFGSGVYAADDYLTLGSKAKDAYEKGNYEEAIKYLSQMIDILQLKTGDSGSDNLLSAGDGFYYSNVSFEKTSTSGFIRCIGEITNKSGNSYSLAFFKISIYDLNDNLLAVGDIMVPNLQDNDTVSFDTLIKDSGKVKDQLKFKIRFSQGL